MLSSFWNFANLIGEKSYPSKVLICISLFMSKVEHLLKGWETVVFLFIWTVQFFCSIVGTFLLYFYASPFLCILGISIPHQWYKQQTIFPTVLLVFSLCLSYYTWIKFISHLIFKKLLCFIGFDEVFQSFGTSFKVWHEPLTAHYSEREFWLLHFCTQWRWAEIHPVFSTWVTLSLHRLNLEQWKTYGIFSVFPITHTKWCDWHVTM